MIGNNYAHVPENSHNIGSGCILIATEKALNIFGHSTVDWVREQGGHKDTIIFILGVHIKGPLPYIEGVFLNPTGVGFHPTWGIEQLIREVREGSWTVIPTETVLESWATKVERLMNKS